MKKIIVVISLLYLLILAFSIIINPQYFFSTIVKTLEVWLYKVYPAIFTFYLAASILINFNILNKFIKIFGFLFKRYRLNTRTLELFITSMFVGNPSSASLIITSVENNTITKNEGLNLIKCASFLTPLFILSFLSFNLKYAFVMILVHIFSSFILLLTIKQEDNHIEYIKRDGFYSFEQFLSSINKVMSLLIMIAGIMVFANIVRESLVISLNYFNINNFYINLILANIEVANGLNFIINSGLDYKLMLIYFSFISSFGGFSVHMQVYNIINKYYSYSSFFKYRIYHAVTSSFLIFILLNI